MLRLPLKHGVAVQGEDCLTDFFRARSLFTYVADRFELLTILLELVTQDHLPLALKTGRFQRSAEDISRIDC